MCGIVGFLSSGELQSDSLVQQNLRRMSSAIIARGPDDSGEWWDLNDGVGLAHRRLSIVDLSMAGHQPFRSKCGRFMFVFNGEIYNHISLRKKLQAQGHVNDWAGHSDTETLLAAITAWGIAPALQQTEGMFAFAVWDQSERQLTLGRDRAGEKPLYYGWQGDCFLFGSQLDSISAHPAFDAAIDPDALAAFIRYSYVPEPQSIYAGISKLPPGCTATISQRHRNPKVVPYWNFCELIKNPPMFVGTPEMAVVSLQRLMRDIIRDQMAADVPVGAFLSGGIDSSLIVSVMQEGSTSPVNTFSIGFEQSGFDEAPHAREVAAALGTKHHEFYMQDSDVTSIVPKLSNMFDEPFADSSQLPTFFLSQMARNHVKVVLSGDAGDELFGGYNRYKLAAKTAAISRYFPNFLLRAASSMISAVPPEKWDIIAAPISSRTDLFGQAGDKIHKLAAIIRAKNHLEMYEGFVDAWFGSKTPVRFSSDSLRISQVHYNISCESEIERMMALDFLTFLPGDILTKVDRASMANSLEVRVPFLNPQVIEFAWSLPISVKMRGTTTKWILRQLLSKYIDPDLINRPKMGFGVPMAKWLRTILRPWAEDLIYSRNTYSDYYLDMEHVKCLWLEHINGIRNWQARLWNILMFLSWLETRHLKSHAIN